MNPNLSISGAIPFFSTLTFEKGGKFLLAYLLDASIAGGMLTMAGVIFGLVYLVAPDRGLIAQLRGRSRQRWEFALTMLAIHLLIHDGLPEAESESQLKQLLDYLRWEEDFSNQGVRRAMALNLIYCLKGRMVLTDLGRERATVALRS